MGAGMSSPLKKRTLREWWEDFCDSVSHKWDSFKVKVHVADRPLVAMQDLDTSLTANPYKSEPEDEGDNDKVVRTSTARSALLREVVPESNRKNTAVTVIEGETHHSSLAIAAAQQSESEKDPMPANMFRTGIAFLAVAGVLSLAALYTGIYPIFGIAGMLTVIGTALMLTAYFANDVEKNGTLTSQVFPPNPTGSFLPTAFHIGYGI